MESLAYDFRYTFALQFIRSTIFHPYSLCIKKLLYKEGKSMDPQDNTIELTQECSLHHYHTQIPNIIFDMKLDPAEFKTYCVLKMTAGDRGSCFKSLDTLCEEIGIGATKLREVKKVLQSKGLIRIESRKHPNGGSYTDLVTIIDIWPLNMKVMSEKYFEKKGTKGGSPNEGGGFASRPRGVRQTDPNKN